MPGIYDFQQDLSQLRLNYQSYDEQLKKAFDNKQFDYNRNKDVATITEDVNGSDGEIQDQENKTDVMGSVGKIANIFGGGEKSSSPKKPDTATPSWNIDTPSGAYSDAATGEVVNPSEGVTGGAGDTMGSVMGIAEFGMQAGSALSNVSESESEGWAQTASLTAKGAQVGMQVGGPWGAAIGGVVGLGVGVVDMFGDAKKRNKMQREAYHKKLDENKTKREQEQRMKDGEESLSKLQALRKSQLNYLQLNY